MPYVCYFVSFLHLGFPTWWRRTTIRVLGAKDPPSRTKATKITTKSPLYIKNILLSFSLMSVCVCMCVYIYIYICTYYFYIYYDQERERMREVSVWTDNTKSCPTAPYMEHEWAFWCWKSISSTFFSPYFCF